MKKAFFLFLLPFCFSYASEKNGFNLSPSDIPVEKILHGGPARDGIPAIDNPHFISTNKVNYLQDDDLILSVEHQGVVRAYPTRILIWHEIVNDSIGEYAFVVTYCPLCGTGIVFERDIEGERFSFGVSGLLYQSDVLMYDRETESLWSQLAMKAVTGDAIGKELKWIASEHLTWKSWQQKYPHGEVLSTDTGFRRNYNTNPYASYFNSSEIIFPVDVNRTELKEKSSILGIIINQQAKAYPIDVLPDNAPFSDQVGGETVIVHYHSENKHPTVTDSQGNVIPSVLAFWFAWQAFYPQTAIWKP